MNIYFIILQSLKSSSKRIKNNNGLAKNKAILENIMNKDKQFIYIREAKKNIISYEKCYISPYNSDLKIIHFIITRFMVELIGIPVDIPYKNIFSKEYILSGFRVLKEYLIPSLENQSCKQFIWILMIGEKINKTYVESLFNFKNSFETKFIYQNSLKNYLRNKTKGYDILITTRIDYDDRIYYDAVNDIRKAINIHRPMIIYGYNRGAQYYENENKYYDFYKDYQNKGVMSIFISMVIVLNQVNDIYTIYDLKGHTRIRSTLIKFFKSFGIQKLDYEPSIFDSGEPKFVWVRHNYSGTLNYSNNIKKYLKLINFNLTTFYGK